MNKRTSRTTKNHESNGAPTSVRSGGSKPSTSRKKLPRIQPARDETSRCTSFRGLVLKDAPSASKIDLIRSGVGARVVNDMAEYLDVQKKVIIDVLLTPESTAHRLIRDNRTLDSAASERVVRVADVTRHAEESLGGRQAAAQWLKSPNLALGGASPLSMLDTEPGAAEVRRVLASIDYGGVL